MYTFNYYVFGHRMAENKEINNTLNEFDIEFSTKVSGKTYEVDFPYHGGQVSGDLYSCVFGTIITDDDNNPDYINDVRSSKEDDYIKDYNIFLDQLKKNLTDNLGEDDDYDNFVPKLIDYLDSNSPTFYAVEASS